jgi:hypothetical protein
MPELKQRRFDYWASVQATHPSPYMPDNGEFTIFIFSLHHHITALVHIASFEQNRLLVCRWMYNL